MSATEGANTLAQQFHTISKDSNKVKKLATTSYTKKRKPKLIVDASKPTVRTHSGKRISNRKLKRAKPSSDYITMRKRAAKFHKYKNTGNRIK